MQFVHTSTLATGTLPSPMPPRPTSAPTPALVYWRTQKALTQRELSEAAGCDLRTVQRLERGEPGQLPTIRRLAKALGVKPADLMAQPPE